SDYAFGYTVYGVQPGSQPVIVGGSGVVDLPTTCTFTPPSSLGTVTSATQFFVVAELYGAGPTGISPYSSFVSANQLPPPSLVSAISWGTFGMFCFPLGVLVAISVPIACTVWAFFVRKRLV